MCRRCAYHFFHLDPDRHFWHRAKSIFLRSGLYLKNYMFEHHEWWLKSKVLSCATFFITTPKSSDEFMRTLWLKNWKIHLHSIGLHFLRTYYMYIPQTSHRDDHTWGDVKQHFILLIRLVILGTEPNMCFYVLIHICKTTHRTFNCNTLKCWSCKVLHLKKLRLRAPMCPWGRYGPKTEIVTVFDL